MVDLGPARGQLVLNFWLGVVDSSAMSIIKRQIRSEAEVPDTSSAWEVDPGSLSAWLLAHGGQPPDGVRDDEASAALWPGGVVGETTATATSTAHEDDAPGSPAGEELPAAAVPDPAETLGEARSPIEDDEEFWVAKLAAAIATARAMDNAEAWRAVAEAANVVSEIANVMERLGGMRSLVTERERAAQEAQREAERLALLVEDAQRTAQEKTRIAEEAHTGAQEALREATAAKEHADKMADEVPFAEEAARTALQESVEAKENAEAFAAAVDRARQANSAEAWREARSARLGDSPRDSESPAPLSVGFGSRHEG